MALADLNRAQDTPIATLMLAEITPKNWHRYPPKVEDATPVYVPTVTYYGGDFGDDQDEASANATTNYQPRNQENRATQLGTVVAKDVGRARGRIEANEPYPTASSPAVPDPVLTQLQPTAGVTMTGPLIVLVIGTGFTPWTIFRGAGRVNVLQSRYQSPTVFQVMVDLDTLPAGTYNLQAVDHNVESNTLPFVVN